MKQGSSKAVLVLWCALGMTLAGCGGGDGSSTPAPGEGRPGGPSGASGRPASSGPGGGGSDHGGGPGGGPNGEARAAVPVEVAVVVRRSISSYIETNGTLEAENDVDIVARTAGPVQDLLAEEMGQVKKGQLLARIDQDEARSRVEISRVALEETKLAFDRARRLFDDGLLSREEYDRAVSARDSSQASFDGNQILLDYTEIRAPFDGVISRRYIKLAENVGVNTPLFRITSFNPLLCPIQVPEQSLPLLSLGQRAHLVVEAWPNERFEAKVLRISPVVDAGTGTVRVTLEVEARGRLRPGMFASVYLETETRPNALVIPRTALALESIGDTVYVAAGEAASRREVRLGFTEGDFVEVTEGVAEGEQVVVVGQDGLSDGTPVQVMGVRVMDGGAPGGEGATAPPAAGTRAEARGGPPEGAPPRGERPDFSNLSPEQLERIKERMRARGMTDEQIEERLRQMRERGGS